ncbi:MAG: cadmium-translocating P-type ATPase [Bacteriovorax sp.]|nr:cadmium-translocating P-type ATPase [Bacteriovorax sp.]
MNLCVHCDEKILIAVFNDQDLDHNEPFCCSGCMTVFNVINFKGLEKYYEIKKQSAIFKRRSPAENKFQKFSYLDNKEFLDDYSYENLNNRKTMEFYLEGIHCLACLWLIEKLPEYLDDVEQCRLDMQRSVATVSLKNNGLFSNVARELNNLGYKPHPLKRNQSIHDLKILEERKMLLKIGIAGAAAGNIMLYAVSIYAGADGLYAKNFNLLSIAFALPVLLYSATPFYQNAWNAIRTRTLSIDIPISLALIIGAISGLYNQFMGINENFFDSLTALVFLLLLSRYFLNKIQEEGLTANDLNFFYEGNSVLKKVDDQFLEIHPQFLKVGDIIKVSTNEMIPADGVIIEGETLINNSLLTGESRPQNVGINENVFSGTINLTNAILIKIENVKENSRVGKILKQIESGWIQKSPIVDLTNKISKYFIAAVFMLATILFITFYSQGKTKIALERSFTLLIVTCPCALALATPLTLTRTLSRASRIGIIIKNNEVVEKLSSIKTVLLDKTGTLTYGNLKINHFKIFTNPNYPIFEVISSLEIYSTHPVATALKEFSFERGARTTHSVDNYKELMGTGVCGEIGNHFYEIKNSKIFEDNKCIAEFTLEDHIRHDSLASVGELKSLGLTVKMISGDQKSIAESVALLAGIDKENVSSEMTPENKLLMIEKNPNALMVGDGANDAMALSRSYVSVAVLGALDISLKASDIYLTTPGISHVANLITISRETMKVVKRNLVLSLIYNSVSVYAAFNGTITPLVAAIIMPISSLTVLASTMIGTKKLNARLKTGSA